MKAPERADSWTMLGAALYHRGEHQPALKAFQKGRELDGRKFGFWDFYVAMAESGLGRKEDARASYARALEWMKRNHTSKLHERLRAQAKSVINSREKATPS